MAAGYDIGASASTSSGAQSGAATIGDVIITGGGKGLGASILPKVPATQGWIVYAVLGVVALLGLALFFRSKK